MLGGETLWELLETDWDAGVNLYIITDDKSQMDIFKNYFEIYEEFLQSDIGKLSDLAAIFYNEESYCGVYNRVNYMIKKYLESSRARMNNSQLFQ